MRFFKRFDGDQVMEPYHGFYVRDYGEGFGGVWDVGLVLTWTTRTKYLQLVDYDQRQVIAPKRYWVRIGFDRYNYRKGRLCWRFRFHRGVSPGV
jgi:hypothetical protein